MPIKIALLCHTLGNIGHSFMAYGMKEIIYRTFPNEVVKIDLFQQHLPFSLHFKWMKGRLSYKLFGPGKFNFIKNIIYNSSFFKRCLLCFGKKQYNIVISVGGPSINPWCFKSIDMKLMFHYMLEFFYSKKISVLNLSNGSCFPLEWEKKLPLSAVDFWKKSIMLSSVVSVRDEIAYSVLKNQLNYDAPIIPCPAVAMSFYWEKYGIFRKSSRKKKVLINYLEKGANDDWGQNIDKKKWLSILKHVIKELSPNFEIVLLCHSKNEYYWAQNLGAYRIYYPKNIVEYGKVLADIKFGIVSRLHAAIPLAGCGIPTIVVGTDTRIYSAKLLGLPIFFVKKVSIEDIKKEIDNILCDYNNKVDHLIAKRNKTLSCYKNLILHYID